MLVEDDAWWRIREIYLLKDLGVVSLRVNRDEIERSVPLHERPPIESRHRDRGDGVRRCVPRVSSVRKLDLRTEKRGDLIRKWMPMFVRFRNHVERTFAARVCERAAQRRHPGIVSPECLEGSKRPRLRLEQNGPEVIVAANQLVDGIVGDAVVRTDLKYRQLGTTFYEAAKESLSGKRVIGHRRLHLRDDTRNRAGVKVSPQSAKPKAVRQSPRSPDK